MNSGFYKSFIQALLLFAALSLLGVHLSISKLLSEEVKTTCETSQLDLKNLYTLVVSTYNRDEYLAHYLDHWLSCPNIYEVQVVWHDPTRQIPVKFRQMEAEYHCADGVSSRLVFMEQETNRLSNRFKPPLGGFKTEAVMNIDDDEVIGCHRLTEAFRQWRKLGTDSMVGFEPRVIEWTPHYPGAGYSWKGACEFCAYNTLWPTKGTFIHKAFYDIYWSDEFRNLRDEIDERTTGEDMLMAFVHFNAVYQKTGKPPPMLAIINDRNVQDSVYRNPNRYSLLEKIMFLKSFWIYYTSLSYRAGLGMRTSHHRVYIRDEIGRLAKEKNSLLRQPKTSKWMFMKANAETILVDSPCTQDYAVQCTSGTSFHALSPFEGWILTVFLIALSVTVVVLLNARTGRAPCLCRQTSFLNLRV